MVLLVLQMVVPQNAAFASINKLSTQRTRPIVCPAFTKTIHGKSVSSFVKNRNPIYCSQGSAVLIDSFSHYMKETSIGSLNSDAVSMGNIDAAKENSQITCTTTNVGNVTAVLDFGQPWGYTTVRNWSGLIMQYTDAQNALTDYINAWLKAAKPCLSLTAVLGVNNSYICGAITPVTPCDRNNGAALEQTAANENAVFSNAGILVVGGSDIEVDPGWSNYNATFGYTNPSGSWVPGWLDGYFGAGADFMYDYGDTCQVYLSNQCTNNGTDWTQCDVYNVAWNIGYDEPLPEIYTPNFANMWATTDTTCEGGVSGPMDFEGIANEQWTGYGWSTAFNQFRSNIHLPSGTPIVVSSTCFPNYYTNWPSDDCYNVNYQ